MIAELVLAGNGPGELAGWVRPVARAARALGGADFRLTLVLSPTQFAGGREPDVVRGWNLFDRTVPPRDAVRVALGLRRLAVPRTACVVHLGGDLWFSSRLARRLGVPACAFAETPLVARRHAGFVKIFAASEELARQLGADGVPTDKIMVTGDPRVDAVMDGVGQILSSAPAGGEGNRVIISILPGSRDRYVRELLPYFMNVAEAAAAVRPGLTFQVIASQFLSPRFVAYSKDDVNRRWPALHVEWITKEPWPALRRSDLVLTVPGTNTAELGMLGVPFAAIVPVELLDRVPAEGLLEWLGRIPVAGRLIKRVAADRYFARPRLLALPNLRAGRVVVPEWIGRWTPAELANRVLELLDDAPRRAAIRAALREVYPAPGGAARAIAERALAIARGVGQP